MCVWGGGGGVVVGEQATKVDTGGGDTFVPSCTPP